MALIPGWISLRKIGNSSVAKATIFMPIIGYFVIFNEEIVKYLHLIGDLSGTKASPGDLNLTRLVSVYIGLFFVGIASIVFLLCCPPELAETASEHEFNQKEMDLMNPLRVAKMQRQLVELGGQVATAAHDEIAKLSQLQMSETVGSAYMVPSTASLSWPDWIGRNRSNISAIVAVKYSLLNDSRYWARVCCIACYCIGFLFLFLPSAEVFIRALGLISRMLRGLFA